MSDLGNMEKQFYGSVSNINMFTKGNLSISYLSANPCSHQGDLLSWLDSTWIQTGEGVRIKDEVCSDTGSYDLGLKIAMGQHEAVATCSKLGHGHMKVANNKKQLHEYVQWFEEKFQGSCHRFWTPYSDIGEEGVFVSLEDGSVPEYLPWALGEPNGDTAENGVEVRTNHSGSTNTIKYVDNSSKKQPNCFACSLSSFFSLQLKGLCGHTLFGE